MNREYTLSPEALQQVQQLMEVCVLPGTAPEDECSRGRQYEGTLDNARLCAAAQHFAGAAS